jgi:RHS repeat-associated protein
LAQGLYGLNRPGDTAALIPLITNQDVILKLNGTSPRQVKSPQGLVDIGTINSYKYELRCYYETDLARDGGGAYILDSNGWYTLNSGATAFSTWTVENPDASSTVYNRLNITEARGGDSRTFAFTYTTTPQHWDLAKPGSYTVTTSKTQDSGDSNVTNTTKQITVGSTVLKKTQTTTKYISALNFPVVTQEVEGDGAVTRTTSYTYYGSSDPAGSQYRLQLAVYPEGKWVYYKYDDIGRTTNEFQGWLNSPPPTSGEPSLSANTYKLTQYFYTLSESDDGYSGGDPGDPENPFSVRKTTVKVPVWNGMAWQLQEVARTYNMTGSMESTTGFTKEMHRCPVPGAQWGDSGNLITYSADYPYDVSYPFKAYRPHYTTREDGTSSIFDYAWTTDGFAITEKSGAPDYGPVPTTIYEGFETTSVSDELGHPLSRTVKPIVGGTTLSAIVSQETYVYKDTGGSYFDKLRRGYDRYDLGLRTNSARYSDCCGLASTTNEDRLATVFEYDEMKRRISSKALVNGTSGIKTTNVLDSAGQVLATKRIGSDSDTDIITLSQTQYDVLGRPARQTNALGGVTAITNVMVSSRLCRTNTYPDGGTKIETFCRDGRPESISGTAVAPTSYLYGAEQDGSVWREYTVEVKLDSSGGTNEWVKTLYDGVGRPYKTIYSGATGNPSSLTVFNTSGQAITNRDPDGVTQLFAYNSKGERFRTAIDIDQNGTIDTDTGTDRITDTIEDVLASGDGGNSRGTDISRARVFKFTTDSSDATDIVSMTEASTDGLKIWRSLYRDPSTPVLTTQITKFGTGGYRTNVVYNSDASSNVTIYLYGRFQVTTNFDTHAAQVTKESRTYDPHGRVSASIDARNGATTYAYNSADLVTSVTSPNPGLGPQVTSTSYDTSLRPTSVTKPDNSVQTTVYYPSGLPKLKSGSHDYPVGYAYDAQFRMTFMTNWQSFSANSGKEVTRWNYDQYRGWLLSEDYCAPNGDPSAAGTTGPTYTYKDSGRLLTRVWRRGITTTYGYNNAGDQSSISYSDSTPGVTFTYDRRGRKAGVSCNSLDTALTWNDADQQLTESYSLGSILSLLSMNSTYDNNLRRTTLEAKQNTTSLQSVGYAYDYAGRMGTVTDNSASSYTANYAYHANSMLVSNIDFKHGTTNILVTAKTFDLLNRLTAISSVASGANASKLPISFAYDYNTANQRIRCVLEDGSYWIYMYDSLGQVTSGKRYWPDGTPVDGQQFEYSFDDIGNRITTGGRASAASFYTRTSTNAYSQRTNAPIVDVLGVANPTASVTVNGNTANRHGEYFHYPLSVANSSSAYPTVTIASTFGGGTSTSGKAFVPASTETFTHDQDGNLTADGRWAYTWDAENRLIQMIRDTDSPSGAREKLVFTYDWMGRRIRKQFYTWNSGTLSYQLSTDTIYLYDGWNLICEFDASSSQPGSLIRSYIWGPDLSGSMQGAGGVGGLLKVTDYTSGTSHHFVAYDGNGDVAALVDGGTGGVNARYEYGPFAEAVRTAGVMAKKMPLRFSTKYTDNESGLIYYGYRYLNPSTGRWMSRDPLAEQAFFIAYCEGKNKGTQFRLDSDSLGPAYCLLKNQPLNCVDRDGCEIGYTYCCDGRMTLDADQERLMLAGAVMTVCDAVGTGAMFVECASSQVSKLKCLRCKVAIHSDHHTFPFLGKKCHLQITCWAKGLKGSGINIRIPVPDRFCP